MQFSDFVRSAHFDRWQANGQESAEFRARLARADIRSLRDLQRWVRERYPDLYYKRPGILSPSTGRELIAKIWADYLSKAETRA